MSETPGSKPPYGALDHYDGKRGAEYFAIQNAHAAVVAEVNLRLFHAHLDPAKDVLDFGCAGGWFLRAAPARRKVGVEINPHARRHAQSLGLEVVDQLDAVTGKFDCITSTHVLEHVPNPLQALQDMRDLLRDTESRLVLLLPLDDWRARWNRSYRTANHDKHLYAWTPQLLGNLLEAAGYRVHDVKVIQHAAVPTRAGPILWRVVPKVYDAAAFLWSGLIRRRQLFAVAGPP